MVTSCSGHVSIVTMCANPVGNSNTHRNGMLNNSILSIATCISKVFNTLEVMNDVNRTKVGYESIIVAGCVIDWFYTVFRGISYYSKHTYDHWKSYMDYKKHHVLCEGQINTILNKYSINSIEDTDERYKYVCKLMDDTLSTDIKNHTVIECLKYIIGNIPRVITHNIENDGFYSIYTIMSISAERLRGTDSTLITHDGVYHSRYILDIDTVLSYLNTPIVIGDEDDNWLLIISDLLSELLLLYMQAEK